MKSIITQKSLSPETISSANEKRMIPIFVGKRKIHKKYTIASTNITYVNIDGYAIDKDSIKFNISYFAKVASDITSYSTWSISKNRIDGLSVTIESDYNNRSYLEYNSRMYLYIIDASNNLVFASKISAFNIDFSKIVLELDPTTKLVQGIQYSAYIACKEFISINNNKEDVTALDFIYQPLVLNNFSPFIFSECSVEYDYIQNTYSFDEYNSYDDISSNEVNQSLLYASKLCSNGFIVVSTPSNAHVSQLIDDLSIYSNGYYIAPISNDIDISPIKSFVQSLPNNDWYLLIEPINEFEPAIITSLNYVDIEVMTPPSYALNVEPTTPQGAFLQIKA